MHDLTTIQRMNAAMQVAAQQPEKRRHQMEVRVQTGSTYIYLVFPRSPRRVYRQLREVAPTLRKYKLLWLTNVITTTVKGRELAHLPLFQSERPNPSTRLQPVKENTSWQRQARTH